MAARRESSRVLVLSLGSNPFADSDYTVSARILELIYYPATVKYKPVIR